MRRAGEQGRRQQAAGGGKNKTEQYGERGRQRRQKQADAGESRRDTAQDHQPRRRHAACEQGARTDVTKNIRRDHGRAERAGRVLIHAHALHQEYRQETQHGKKLQRVGREGQGENQRSARTQGLRDALTQTVGLRRIGSRRGRQRANEHSHQQREARIDGP